ncbi:MAG: hypothetical protein WBC04_26010 [Candidatus Acidiferrales bacterium]
MHQFTGCPGAAGHSADFAPNVVERARRGTLIAKKLAATGVLEWSVILQGHEETVFFDC